MRNAITWERLPVDSSSLVLWANLFNLLRSDNGINLL